MKLATLRDGSRDGRLAVVSRDLSRALAVPDIAATLQDAIDRWEAVESLLRAVAERVEQGEGEPFDSRIAMAPLPRTYQWADFSAYVTHVELVRKARGAGMPESFWNEPLCYQGAGDRNLGPTDPIPFLDEADGVDFEGELAVIVDDVPTGTPAREAGRHIKLFVLLNDVTLRNRVPAELEKGFGFFQSKPQTAFAPVAVTPDELGAAWDGGCVDLAIRVTRGDTLFGTPNASQDMVFKFPRLIEHVAATRPIGAGAIIGAGTISNSDRSVGSACIAERRAEETVAEGAPKTGYLREGERVHIEMPDDAGRSIFGAIDQIVTRVAVP
ncbi:MAG: fumarylacetoacetate hydrolase family protein [Bradyrhizobium sp.]|nr:fumarylacetoacetate hydrolase family protein [Bradyrhizobium sp.]